MTETTKVIFRDHEIRKTKKQKKAFRAYLRTLADSYGYNTRCESVGKHAHNVVVGDPVTAKVVYTAHYDTCAFMPFPNFITPLSIPIYLLYQLIMSIVIYIIPFIFMFVLPGRILDATDSYGLYLGCMLSGYALLILFTYLLLLGPANRHTANDNTSGVTLLIDIMRDIPDELKSEVAFIFFDLEELGLIGSKGYAKRHSRVRRGKLVINFDCVSDGKSILFALRKKATVYKEKIAEAFRSNETYSVEIASKGTFYPSDQLNFDLGVGVAALKKTRHGLLYMNRIHTPRDTVYDEENIVFLKNGAIELTRLLSKL